MLSPKGAIDYHCVKVTLRSLPESIGACTAEKQEMWKCR
jgi:hypothetical protein